MFQSRENSDLCFLQAGTVILGGFSFLVLFLFSVRAFLTFAGKALLCSLHFCFQWNGGEKEESCDFPCNQRGNIWFSREGLQYQPIPGEECTPRMCVTLQMYLCQPDSQSHHERWCREEAGTRWGPEREHKVKPRWTSTQGTAGTVCGSWPSLCGFYFQGSETSLILSWSPAHTTTGTQHVNTLPSLLHCLPSLSFILQRSLNKKTTPPATQRLCLHHGGSLISWWNSKAIPSPVVSHIIIDSTERKNLVLAAQECPRDPKALSLFCRISFHSWFIWFDLIYKGRQQSSCHLFFPCRHQVWAETRGEWCLVTGYCQGWDMGPFCFILHLN